MQAELAKLELIIKKNSLTLDALVSKILISITISFQRAKTKPDVLLTEQYNH